MYCSDFSTRQALDTLEQAANIIDNWLKDIGLKIAPNKSQLCIFRKISTKIRLILSLSKSGT